MKSARLALVFSAFLGCGRAEPGAEVAARVTFEPPKPDADGFVPIPGDRLTLFAPTKGRETAALTADEPTAFNLRGDGRGYACTAESYRDFTLRFRYRWPAAVELAEADRPNANTGVLIFTTGEDKVWPRCLEVQGKWSEMGAIKSNARDVIVTARDDEPARERARKPVGDWNEIEVIARAGAVTSFVNGVKVAESEPTELREGPIGFQLERFDVEFRDVRIRRD